MTGSARIEVELNVDGDVFEVEVRPHHLLVDVLRSKCGRTSVKVGCETAGCGACTVLIDGRPSLACVTLVQDAVGRKVETVESLSRPNAPLHPLQEAFIRHHAVQCGFCTPGVLLAAFALLQENPDPTDRQISDALSGNLCRCTGYVRIIQAVADAAKTMQAQ